MRASDHSLQFAGSHALRPFTGMLLIGQANCQASRGFGVSILERSARLLALGEAESVE